jgi:hypothetical protein
MDSQPSAQYLFRNAIKKIQRHTSPIREVFCLASEDGRAKMRYTPVTLNILLMRCLTFFHL